MNAEDLNDLIIWASQGRRKPESYGALPNQTRNPNPLIVGNLMILSCFSPGGVFAYHKVTGKLVWKYRLNYLGGAFAAHSRGKLLVYTSREIVCLKLKTGKRIWNYVHIEGDGENSYSGANFYGSKVLLGDLDGNLHALNEKNGSLIWKSNIDANSRINSLPLSSSNTLFVVTSTGLLAALNPANGKVNWSVKLPGGSAHSPVRFGQDLVIASSKGLVRFSLKTRKFIVFGKGDIREIVPMGDRILAVTSTQGKRFTSRLRVFKAFKEQFSIPLGYSHCNLVLINSDVVAASGIGGIDFVSIKKRRKVAMVRSTFFPSQLFSVERGRMFVTAEKTLTCAKLPSLNE